MLHLTWCVGTVWSTKYTKQVSFLSVGQIQMVLIAIAKLNVPSNERQYHHREFCKCCTSLGTKEEQYGQIIMQNRFPFYL